eukprot:767592-Hanusia_phi.AAC.1
MESEDLGGKLLLMPHSEHTSSGNDDEGEGGYLENLDHFLGPLQSNFVFSSSLSFFLSPSFPLFLSSLTLPLFLSLSRFRYRSRSPPPSQLLCPLSLALIISSLADERLTLKTFNSAPTSSIWIIGFQCPNGETTTSAGRDSDNLVRYWKSFDWMGEKHTSARSTSDAAESLTTVRMDERRGEERRGEERRGEERRGEERRGEERRGEERR